MSVFCEGMDGKQHAAGDTHLSCFPPPLQAVPGRAALCLGLLVAFLVRVDGGIVLVVVNHQALGDQASRYGTCPLDLMRLL